MAADRTIQYQIQTEPVLATPEQVTESRWHQPWSEPVRFKCDPRANIALMAAGYYGFPQDAGEVIFISKYYQAWSEPKRFLRGLAPYKQQFLALVEAAPFEETAMESKFHQPWSEPVRYKPLGQYSAHEQQTLAYHPRPIVDIGWFEPLSVPVTLKKPGLRSDEQQTFAYHPFPVIDISWFEPLSEPKRYNKETAYLHAHEQFVTFHPLPIIDISWFEPLSEPRRYPPETKYIEEHNPFEEFGPLPITDISWFNWLSEPKRFPRGLPPWLQQFLAFQIAFFPEKVELEWYEWWSEPKRFLRGMQYYEQPTYTSNIFPIPPQPTGDTRRPYLVLGANQSTSTLWKGIRRKV